MREEIDMNLNREDEIDILNNLIETCKDGQEGFRSAAESVNDSHLKSLFNEFALQRAQFAGDLQAEVRRLGGDPEKAGSVSGSLHRGWIGLKSAITGKSDAAIIAECERGEDSAKEAYQKALDSGLPADVRSIIERQYMKVKSAHDQVRNLQLQTQR
jgi:uncharacterized protein (TIGR02284 family)